MGANGIRRRLTRSGVAFMMAAQAVLLATYSAEAGKLVFRHHFVDRDLPGGGWGQTALADLDGDGDLDFITGRSNGPVRWYEFRDADHWVVHRIADRSPSDVGAATMDVDGDGRIDVIVGGQWYRNPGDRDAARWLAYTFDIALRAVHDIVLADLDGDGRRDVVTMSDRNDLRWYRIAKDPTKPWTATRIGPSVHAGICAGDIDRDGDVDIVRSTVWFENRDRGHTWVEHELVGIPWAPGRPFPQASRARLVDINRDGRLDLVLTEAEIAGGRVAWFEAPPDPRSGPWKPHILTRSGGEPRGPFHSLAVADFDNDGDLDIFAGEMEHLGRRPHRWFIWENVSGDGSRFVERVILDAGLGTHEAVAGDVDRDGDIDLVGKLWRPDRGNANEGRNHVDFLENLLKSRRLSLP